jgi:hypothetical protein
MKVFALGDLHLSHQVEKPMDIFGARWGNHTERIRENWTRTVGERDLVIIPGDFSWATYLAQAEEDFKFLDSLPGRKAILKGNHDYWWETVTKMGSFLESIGIGDVEFLYNNSIRASGMVFFGTKGWDFATEKEEKIINRETIRLNLSLQDAKKYEGEKIAVFHYPPDGIPGLTALMKENGIKRCIHGHVHGYPLLPATYEKEGITYINVSADQIGFTPFEIKSPLEG